MRDKCINVYIYIMIQKLNIIYEFQIAQQISYTWVTLYKVFIDLKVKFIGSCFSNTINIIILWKLKSTLLAFKLELQTHSKRLCRSWIYFCALDVPLVWIKKSHIKKNHTCIHRYTITIHISDWNNKPTLTSLMVNTVNCDLLGNNDFFNHFACNIATIKSVMIRCSWKYYNWSFNPCNISLW